jgi:acyl-CoA thioester hydrolase
MPFRSIQRVYFDDLDALNILHNVRYLLFMERARGEFFDALGFRWEDPFEVNPDKYHVIAEHQIKYLVPVHGEGELVVEIAPTHLGTTSLILRAEVRSLHGSAVFAQGTTRLVRVDARPIAASKAGSGKPAPAPWSERFRQAIAPLVLG